MSGKVPNAPYCDRGRLHVLGMDADIDPSVGRKLRRGIYASDRVHSLVVGLSRCGKTRFLLSMIKQHLDNGEGFLVLDSQCDLSRLVLSHIPPEQWDRVIYINPWTAFEDKYDNKVVQINFLETISPLAQTAVAEMFTDAIEKIYTKEWKSDFENILLNALCLVMEKEETAKLSYLYRVLSNNPFRDKLAEKCKNESVKTFWEKQYKLIHKDGTISVLTKLYRLCEELAVVPMLKATKSSINFRQALEEKKIIIVDLPEKAITKNITSFIGSLILLAAYNAAMSRENMPWQERQAFYIYADQAHNYFTRNMIQTLKTLQKHKIHVTLASQNFEQYHQDIQSTLTQVCQTFITFQVKANTAQKIEHLYPQQGYQTLLNLPPHHFYASTRSGMNNETQVLG